MTVTHVWCGATTDTSVWVRGKVTGSSVRLAVSESEALTSPVYVGPVTPTNNIASLAATGLEPGTRYWYALEDGGVLDTAAKGTFRTHPVAAGERASFVFGAAGDAGLAGGSDAGVGDIYITAQTSDNPVFDTMRTQALAEDWLMFCHIGDLHYRDIATASDALYRTAYDDTLTFNGTLGTAARQGQFFRNTAMTYVWDDHDFGANNSNKTSVSRSNACNVYRERVPHYTLPAGAGANSIYQSWQVGRVLFIASDVRADRDPNGDPQSPTKTMLGTGQRAWMESVLSTSDAEALVWIMPSRWLGLGLSSPTTDTWDSFLHERQQLSEMFGDLGWQHRMIQLTADKHSLGICSGPNNPYGAHPVYMLASLDASYGDNDGLYDVGQLGGRQQYGTVSVRDDGHTIALTGTGYINGTVWRSHTAYVHVGSPVLALNYGTDLVPPLEPTDDDQRIVNDVTATRDEGGEYRVVEDTGPLSTLPPPAGVGVYDEAATVNVATDNQLPDQASWRVHQGTVDEARFPLISLNLARNPELADQVAALAEGDRLTISNQPDTLPPGVISQIAEGTTETLSQYQWDVSLNASPASPYTVAAFPTSDPADVGPDEPNRADTTGSELVFAVDGDDTTLILNTPQDGEYDRATWIISAGGAVSFADQFPLDLQLGGETVRATAIQPHVWDNFTRTSASGWGTSDSGTAWTETGGATSDRTVGSGVGIITLATAPTTARIQRLVSPVADTELLVVLGPGQVSTGNTIAAGLLLRYGSSSAYYQVRTHFRTDSAVYLSVSNVGTDVGAQVVTPLTYTAGSFFWLRARVVGHSVYGRVWKFGTVEPGRWQVVRTVTSNTVAAGDVGVTCAAVSGNTNVSPLVQFDGFQIVTPQRATVTRSLNSVTKAHDAGTAVSLARPATLAL